MVAVLLEEAEERFGSAPTPFGWLVGECVRIVSAGLGLRRDALAHRTRGVVRGLRLDLRLAVRALIRAPTFSMAAVGMISLGVGANAAVLTMARASLTPPRTFAQPDRLVVLWGLAEDGGRRPLPADRVGRLAGMSRTLSDVGFVTGVTDGSFGASVDDAVDHVRVANVTANFFEVLGVPTAERGIAPEGGVGAATASRAFLSHELWTTLDDGRPWTGRTVIVDGQLLPVAGVTPPGTRLPLPPAVGLSGDADVWVTLPTALADVRRGDGRFVDQDSDNGGMAIARLARGVTLDDAGDEIGRLAAQGSEASSRVRSDSVVVRSYVGDATDHLRPLVVGVALGATALLLVALLNLSTLTLARWSSREGELLLRRALGATRLRLVRLVVVEAVVIGVAAGVGGSVVATVTLTSLSPAVTRLLESPVGSAGPGTAVVLLGCLVASLVSAAPSILAFVRRREPGSGGLARGGRFVPRARRVFTSAQVGLSTVLMVVATLVLSSVENRRRADPGFRPAHVLTFRASMRAPDRFGGPADRARLMRELEDRLADLPGVEAVGLVGALPLSGRRWEQPWGRPGDAPEGWDESADFRVATSGYFEALGIERLRGRTFTRTEDLEERRRVVVLDEAMARRLANRVSVDETAIVGRGIAIPLDGAIVEAEVVGVVRSVRHDDLLLPAQGTIYVPYRQEASRDVDVVVRTDGDPGTLAGSVRDVVREVDPAIPVFSIRTMDAWVRRQIAPFRLTLLLLAAFAVLSLMAGAAGLYGVVAFEVARRVREIGVRMAVGAPARALVARFVADGLMVAGPGLAAGLGIAVAMTSHPQVTEILGEPVRPASWFVGSVATAAVLLLATWLPARRAAKQDPQRALRGK